MFGIFGIPALEIFGALVVFVFLVLIGVGFLSFLCGILFPQKKRSLAYVIGKASTPAYSQIISFQEASVWSTLPNPLFFPESWWVRVEILDQLVNISVEREVYNSVSEGDIVIAEYVCERFSGHIRLKEIYPM